MKTPHINKSNCKKYLLDPANQRAYKMTRVSGKVFENLDNQLVQWMHNLLTSQPSKGKTIT